MSENSYPNSKSNRNKKKSESRQPIKTALILWKNTKKTKSSLEMSRNSWNYVSAITSLLRRQIFPKKSKPARSFTPSAMCFFLRPFQIHRRTRYSEVSYRKWFMTNRRMSLRFTTISQIRKILWLPAFQVVCMSLP